MSEWHCVLFGQPRGPFSEERMREMLMRGEIAGDTLVWSGSTPSEAARGWVRADETEFAQFLPPSTEAPQGPRAPLLSRMAQTEQGEQEISLTADFHFEPRRIEAPQRVSAARGEGSSGELSGTGEAALPFARAFRGTLGLWGHGGFSSAALSRETASMLAPREGRLAAFMINLVIPCAFFLIFKALPAFFFFNLRALAVGVAGLTGVIALACLGFNLYFLNRDGQSLGKKAMRARIVDTDGDWAPLWRVAGLRWIIPALVGVLLWLKPVLGIALFLADAAFVFRKDRRTLRDLIAGTIVMKAREEGTEEAAS